MAVPIFLTACFRTGEKTLTAAHDLRAAQLLLRVRDEPAVMRHLQGVDEEIDAAISVVGGDDRPEGVDLNFTRPERFRKSLALLSVARAKTAGRNEAAVQHIDGAAAQLRRASAALGIGLESNEGDQK
jgi:hypothetical protein